MALSLPDIEQAYIDSKQNRQQLINRAQDEYVDVYQRVWDNVTTQIRTAINNGWLATKLSWPWLIDLADKNNELSAAPFAADAGIKHAVADALRYAGYEVGRIHIEDASIVRWGHGTANNQPQILEE